MADQPGRWLRSLANGRIPLPVKLLVLVWVVVLVPDHWRATPLSLLWFCNVALILTLIGLWLESSLTTSMAAVGYVWWGLLWVFDFALHFVARTQTTPLPLGMSNYMFDLSLSPFSRGLSLYHAWLPFLLLWSVWRLGYDRRALCAQTVLAWVVVLLSYVLTDSIHGSAGNLNQIYGLSPIEPQHWVPPKVWLALVMLFCPLCWYLPTHLIFIRIFTAPSRPRSTEPGRTSDPACGCRSASRSR